ncbi:MAG: hypothetical protein L6R48_25305 [Planctomycetes bacterium]|nr:hypothetical protein [Planctomycetota bacterium]
MPAASTYPVRSACRLQRSPAAACGRISGGLLWAVVLLAAAGASLWLGTAGVRDQRDPALSGDRRAYARATGGIITPAGVAMPVAFSDGPGRVTVADALALAGGGQAAAAARLGTPDLVLGGDQPRPVALWWNAIIPARRDDTQPPALHCRLDLAAAPGRPLADARVTRVACVGALAAELHTSGPR